MPIAQRRELGAFVLVIQILILNMDGVSPLTLKQKIFSSKCPQTTNSQKTSLGILP
jgi:hypothetical protein